MESLPSSLQNPFSSSLSNSTTFDGESLLGTDLAASYREAHEVFRKAILDKKFACIAAQAAMRLNTYVFAQYEDLTDPKVAEAVCHDLLKFILEFDLHGLEQSGKFNFVTFVAHFKGPPISDQVHGSECLDALLSQMHAHDKKYFPWASGVSADIESPDFAFSIGGQGFFVPLLYPFASSESRRTEEVYVVFNPHVIFENLRKLGGFEGLRDKIRARQKNVHPHLADHGQGPAYHQYALIDPDKLPLVQAIRRKALTIFQ